MAHDPIWMKVFLGIHIAAGAGSFLLAPVALATAKGGKQHKRWGMVYLWCMGVVAGTALPMALYRPVLFLALVAVFSYYAAFSGYRVLKLKSLAKGGSAQAIDWVAGGVTFVSSLCLALLGAHSAVLGTGLRGGIDCVRVPGDAVGVHAAEELYSQADGEDVLVVHAPGKLHRKLHRGLDGVQRGDPVAGVS